MGRALRKASKWTLRALIFCLTWTVEQLEALLERVDDEEEIDLWSVLENAGGSERARTSSASGPDDRAAGCASPSNASAVRDTPLTPETARPPWMTDNEAVASGRGRNRAMPPPLDRALQRQAGTTPRRSAVSATGRAVSGNTTLRDTDPGDHGQVTAARTIASLNPNALIAFEEGKVVVIEDHTDPDGRMFRLEYRSTTDGQHAIAFCLHNPWDTTGRRNAGEAYSVGHVAEDGFLCLGTHSTRSLHCSPYDLQRVILRSRYWCTGFSVLKETGEYPNL